MMVARSSKSCFNSNSSSEDEISENANTVCICSGIDVSSKCVGWSDLAVQDGVGAQSPRHKPAVRLLFIIKALIPKVW